MPNIYSNLPLKTTVNQNTTVPRYLSDVKVYNDNSLEYIPKFVDRSLKFPISKGSKVYETVKAKVKTHMEYAGLELDFHKLEMVKDHIEAAMYYLKNIE